MPRFATTEPFVRPEIPPGGDPGDRAIHIDGRGAARGNGPWAIRAPIRNAAGEINGQICKTEEGGWRYPHRIG